MNKASGNPLYYYHRSDPQPGQVVASLRPIPESDTLDYLGKRYLFSSEFYSVTWRYDQPPLFFDHKAAAGCFAACHDTDRITHEVESPLTVSFLSDWAHGRPDCPTGKIVFTDEKGGLTLTFERRPDEPIIDLSFDRMIVENHEWDERHYDPQLFFGEEEFERNEKWRFSLKEWDELILPFGEEVPPDPFLTFFDPDDEDEQRSFPFRYMYRLPAVPIREF